MTIKEIGNVTLGRIIFDALECGQYFNFKNYDVTNFNGIDKRTLYYVWLADSAMTLHIVNQYNIFKTFTPIKDTPIMGVRGL